ncbi:hypothetical protein JGF97_23995 [Salmonella enterica subsp. enterica serovar Typhimurium]|nr:hypothetical protein [Salmonella enterica subsp. enterica serovar Typhimurium]
MLLKPTAIRKDGRTYQVFLPYIIDELSERHRKRPAQWFKASLARLQGAPIELQEFCTPKLISGEWDHRTDWISVFDALALLACSPDSYQNDDLIKEIEHETKVELPVKPGRSKHEAVFGERLNKTLKRISETSGRQFSVITQKHFNGRKYRVDFVVTLEGAPKQYVIEFDEAFHAEKRQRERDLERDRWFRKHEKTLDLIRVEHKHQDNWLKCLEGIGEPRPIEHYYAHCIRVASEIRSKTERVITGESSKAAYNPAKNGCSCLLKHDKRRLKELSAIMVDLNIPFRATDRLFVTRLSPSKYGL